MARWRLASGAALILLATLCPLGAVAQDTIELETTTIKGNKELPKILYIVPWKEVETGLQEQQQLILHSLSDDLFDPVLLVTY